ncbi:MAG: diguanylate cyclase [Lachnospiraceae bacterium]|nr:diguanylate cyclase [Lachnospiraceae bacterium]
MENWIVIVDDEALSLTSARVMLSAEDMKISCLTSGKDLIRFMEKKDPDLILLDVMMPGLDGFETFETLRRLEKEQNRPETPVIFLTGESDHEAEQYGLKLGAADYIHKPFNKEILISRIRNTINNSKKIVSLTENATKDKLTGFLNKAEGIIRVKEALEVFSGALVILDLDSFKLVNDIYGHEKGDQILKAFADVSRISTREGDILCRIGGDEFLFFCKELNGEAALSAFSVRLNGRFEEKSKQILGDDHGIPLGISVGAVMVPEYGRDYEKLFNMADEAMYLTKNNGKHGCTLYAHSEVPFESGQDPEEELLRIIKIIEERNRGTEALMLGKDAFSAVFNSIERLNERNGGRSCTLLFIVKAKESVNEELFKKAVTSFGEVLKKTLKKSDLIMQSRNNQFLVLLPLIQGPDPEDAVNRVMSGWNGITESSDFEIEIASKIRGNDKSV